MLIRARKGLPNNNNIAIFKNKIIVSIPILNPNEQVVIVKQNAT